ncbi:NAD(P)H-hydrate dehydratase [Granulosicoccaceae sp. 1_MG-2023]|nr:NAD(P)H-hydrate dehydratase [Granulosicoccaceae sp. 1_MG-2023]
MSHSALYSAEDCRELDRIAIEVFGIGSYDLMCRAGRRLCDAVLLRWPQAAQITVFCGGGNNGGDGYVLGRLLLGLPGKQVRLVAMVPVAKLHGDAARAAQDYLAAGGEVSPASDWPALLSGSDLLVDALFGSGLSRPVEGVMAELIEAMNASALPVLAVDVPSGLAADTGAALGVAVRAALTVTFIGDKRGLYTGDGPDCAGQVHLAGLDVPAPVYARRPAAVHRFSPSVLLPRLIHRPQASHKGSAGRLLVLGGDARMQGAAVLAGTAALRAGAGLVRVALGQPLRGLAAPPDLMFETVSDTAGAAGWLPGADALVIGPGLGGGEHAANMLEVLKDYRGRLLLDADALNALAEKRYACPAGAVLTPHPAEAARLLGCSTAQVQADRFAAVTELARVYQSVVLLKGVGTLVSDGQQIRLIDRGSPAMAVAGMGDVLSGVIGALLAQGFGAFDAACLGAWWHASAATWAAAAQGFGLMARDLPDALWPALAGEGVNAGI